MRWLPLVALLGACNHLNQSDECKQYLACQEAITPGSSVNFASYGETGSCWSTDLRSAEACTAACVQGRQTLAAGAGQGKAECQ